jgi:hypothetical protein
MSPLAALRRFRHNRLLAALALLALLFATSAYAVHGFQHELPLSQHSTAHCDLCLQFSGTAGTPDYAGSIGKPPQATFAPDTVETVRYSSHRHPTNRLPRAPPALT